MAIDQLERARRICLAFPEATEKKAWGEATFRVRDRVFAMFASAKNHHGAGSDGLWCPAPEGTQQMLAAAEPDRFFVPPYVGKGGWIGMHLDRVSDAEIEVHLYHAYGMVAPPKLRARSC